MYDVRRLRQDEQLQFALSLLKAGNYIQFIVNVPPSFEYPTGYETKEAVDATQLKIKGVTDEMMLEFLRTDKNSGLKTAYKGLAHTIVAAPSRLMHGSKHRS